jgi:hypothetical protein
MRNTSMCGKLLAVTTALLIFSVPAIAQDDDAGPITQGEDARYLNITYVKFKTGQREAAMEIISEYFVPASQKAGTRGPIMAIHFQTGKWDAAFIWEMDGGMADLEWYRSPDDIKWFAALAEITGGEEQAGELWAKYLATVADAQTEVGHHHVPEAD